MEKDLTFDPLSSRVGPDDDLMDNELDINALGQAFDTTWGRSSTPMTTQCSVKFSLTGQRMIVTYGAIVNFVTERNMVDQKRRYASEAVDAIAAHLKIVKERYKDLSGKTLKASEVKSSSSVEVIGMNSYNPRRTMLYRYVIVYDVA